MNKRNIFSMTLLALGLAAVSVPLILALPWLLFPLRNAERIKYPDRVTFTKISGIFAMVDWGCEDWDRPTQCPLIVHFNGSDMDAKYLSSVERLHREEWTKRIYENPPGTVTAISMSSPSGLVECAFRSGQLTNVSVNAAKVEPGEVAVSYRGRRVVLPATADEITGALGPPLPKD